MFHLVSKVFFFHGSCSVRHWIAEQKASVRLNSAEQKPSVRQPSTEQKPSVRLHGAEQKASGAKSRAVLNFVPNRSSDSLILGDKLFYM